MSIRNTFDLSAYFVVGPENTNGRPVSDVVKAAVNGGFTFVQIRSKVASARELIGITAEASYALEELNAQGKVALLVDDRLDVVLACRAKGVRVDGIHVGQSDIPVEICRRYLGEEAIVGLSARTSELIDYVKNADVSQIDYFGAGPLHETATKPDCGMDENGIVITRSLEELSELARISAVPVVVGGGVKLKDIPELKNTGVDGFFVVSAVAGAEDPYVAAKELVDAWKIN